MRKPTLDWQQDEDVLRIRGHLTAAQIPTMSNKFPTPGAQTTIDLEQTERVDSAGVALLLSWAQQTAEPLTLDNPPDQLKSLISIFNLGDQFTIRP